jgi:glycosyltransferase involved in cell wall biosynthesis
MSRSLQIAMISTDYPPLRTSAAVQLRDLAQQFAAMGHRPVMIVPSELASGKRWTVERLDGIEVLRVAALPTRSPSLFRRAITEMWLPFAMWRNIRKGPFASTKWDLIVWYSPPIFFGPLIWVLRRASGGRTYLILRDIFPEWAVDLGLVRKGPVYLLFKAIAALQYAVADVIGVQTPSNLNYLSGWASSNRRVEVLRNWLAVTPNAGCSISIADTSLAGRKIFVYIGNMGVAQGMDILIELIESLRDREDIGFLFVGRGTEFSNLVSERASRGLQNALFFNEIDSSEIPGLLAQCHVGLVALHPDHKTHNIPGKFVSYVQYGLPVLARVNAGTDLERLIEVEGVGNVYAGSSAEELRVLALQLADNDTLRSSMSDHGRQLGRSMFSPETAARQIVESRLAPGDPGRHAG